MIPVASNLNHLAPCALIFRFSNMIADRKIRYKGPLSGLTRAFLSSQKARSKTSGSRTATFYAQTQGPAPDPDTAVRALAKLIPTEIISVYLAALGFVEGMKFTPGLKEVLLWIIYVAAQILCLCYLKKFFPKASTTQHILSCVAFLIWAFILGGVFSSLSWYNPALGTLVAIFYPTIVLIFWTENDL